MFCVMLDAMNRVSTRDVNLLFYKMATRRKNGPLFAGFVETRFIASLCGWRDISGGACVADGLWGGVAAGLEGMRGPFFGRIHMVIWIWGFVY